MCLLFYLKDVVLKTVQTSVYGVNREWAGHQVSGVSTWRRKGGKQARREQPEGS